MSYNLSLKYTQYDTAKMTVLIEKNQSEIVEVKDG